MDVLDTASPRLLCVKEFSGFPSHRYQFRVCWAEGQAPLLTLAAMPAPSVALPGTLRGLPAQSLCSAMQLPLHSSSAAVPALALPPPEKVTAFCRRICCPASSFSKQHHLALRLSASLLPWGALSFSSRGECQIVNTYRSLHQGSNSYC